MQNYIEVSLDQFGRATSKKVYQNWPIASGELSELYSYDIVGNLIGYTDPARKLNEDCYTVSYKYDALNRVTEVKDAMNQVTCANYTVLGNVDSVKLKANARDTGSISLYTKAYNELDGVQSKTDSSLQSTVYSYNTIGLNTKIVDRNKSINNFTYDGLNQLKETTQVSADNLTSMGYKYSYSNPFGYDNEQLYINAALAATNYYTYDASGQITQKRVSGSNFIYSNLEMKYKDSGRLERLGVDYFYSTYKYINNRLKKVQTNGSYAVSSDDSHNATYDYYPDGKLKKITYPKLNDNKFLTTEYIYNALGRMTSMANKIDGTVLSQFTYTYDANGNITSVNDGLTTKTYLYDKLNRLIEIQPQTGTKTIYMYDLRGNRLIENSPDAVPEYVDTSYSYYLDNQLKSITKGTSVITMKYYADGLRAKKETSSSSTSYIYNLSGKLVAESQGTAAITANYVWGPDRALVKKEVGGGEYYYLYNGHGDVVQMVDRNGKVVNNYEYDEWGNMRVCNETISNPFKYAGEVFDQETGLYYLRARYYDPNMGRFINEDTYEGQVNNPLSLNVYTYCINNPLIYIDTTGNKPRALKSGGYYYFDPTDMSYDLTITLCGFAPWGSVSSFVGDICVGEWLMDYKYIEKSDLQTAINNIVKNSSNIVLDIFSNVPKSKIIKAGTDYISKTLTAYGIYNTFKDSRSYAIDNIIYGYFSGLFAEFGDVLTSKSRDDLVIKYFYLKDSITKAIENGDINVKYSNDGTVTSMGYSPDKMQEIADGADLYLNNLRKALKK